MGATQSAHKEIVHTTSKGKLRGIQNIDNETQKPAYYRFTSVPYALPPVGDRRWRRPEKLPVDFSFNGPDGQPGDYTKFPSVCPQPHYDLGEAELENSDAAPAPETVFDENCLYLNIWIPTTEPPAGGWPVQFYIHGGWLQIGDANHANKFDPYYLMQDFPRVIVAPAYRLGLFGFMTCNDLGHEDTSHAPGNYGFWDQRAALEWTHSNIAEFGGNPDNISVGGLSAGAYSTIFQLNYDIRRPEKADRLIRRVYLHSNAVGVQPKAVFLTAHENQVDELVAECNIPTSLSSQEKLDALRQVPAAKLIEAVHRMKQHTFRAVTDGDFVNDDFLAKVYSGDFGKILAGRGIDVMLGEVADEATLYRMVNPASSHETLYTQLLNYYPEKAVQALLEHYTLPKEGADKDEWADIGSIIIADCQVHATIRGFAAALSPEHVFRYRISWRAKALDKWLEPKVGMCHASDIPVWWACGRRAGYEQADIDLVDKWQKPFYQYLKGERPDWEASGIKQIKEMTADGKIKVVEDKNLDKGLQTWEVLMKAQMD